MIADDGAVERVRARGPLWVVLAVACALGLLLQLRIWPLFAEDAFIALRYARNLCDGDGLVWSAGERVEGYSMLLWILLCAGAMALGVEPVLAARGLGVLCYAAAVAAMLRLWPARRWRDLPAALIGPCVLVASSTGATWMMGGLEEPLVAALLAWSLVGLRALLARPPGDGLRPALWAGLPFALLCLARSEGPVWLVAPAAAVWWRRRPRFRAVLAFVAPAVVVVLGQLGFRLAYYGDWLPNTAYLKVNPSWGVLHEGLRYLGGAFASARGVVPLAALGLVAAALQRGRRAALLLVALPLVCWSCYLALIGGDYFPSYRRFVPAVLLLGLLAAEGLAWLSRARVGVAALLAAAGAGVLAWDAARDPSTQGLRATASEWRNVAFGEMLHAAFAPQDPLVAVDAAGGIPYGSRLRHLDMLGFNDRTVARTPISAFAWQAVRQVLQRDYIPGHMHGNGRYVLDREPDLVLFSSAPCMLIPPFVSGNEMQDDARWRDGYRAVQFVAPPCTLPTGSRETMRVPMWVRCAGRLGVRNIGAATTVPGLLLGSHRQAVPFHLLTPPARGTPEFAAFDRGLSAALTWQQATPVVAVLANDHVEAEFVAMGEAACDGVPLAAGRYRIEVDPAAAPVEVRVEAGGVVLGDRAAGFTLPAAAEVRVVSAARAGTALPCRVRELRLLREP